MDDNESNGIAQAIENFIKENFNAEGRDLYRRLLYFEVSSRIKDDVNRSLRDDLHKLREIRNDIVHKNFPRKWDISDKNIRDLYSNVWEGLLRLAVPERENVPFMITNRHSGLCLDVPCGFSNGRIHQFKRHGQINQQWILRKTEDGSVVIISMLSGKCLDVEYFSYEQSAPLLVWQYNGGDNQKYNFEPLEDGSYKITVKHTGFVLDGTWGRENGTEVIQWEWHGGDNQHWFISPVF